MVRFPSGRVLTHCGYGVMKDKYVFDSNIWIEIHRGKSEILKKAMSLIDGNCVCLIDVIITELLRGTRTEKDYHELLAAFSVFPLFATSWERVGPLAFKVATNGFLPPLIDIYIAQAVYENNKTLITLDRHFAHIAKSIPLSVEFW